MSMDISVVVHHRLKCRRWDEKSVRVGTPRVLLMSLVSLFNSEVVENFHRRSTQVSVTSKGTWEMEEFPDLSGPPFLLRKESKASVIVEKEASNLDSNFTDNNFTDSNFTDTHHPVQ